MNDEKWYDIIELIDDKFEVLDKTKEEIPIGDDLNEEKTKETIETVEFIGPVGKMKVERTTRPIVLDKKTHYSKRAGDKARVEYTYSDTEKTQKMKAYRWSDEENDWTEIDSSGLGF